MKEKNNHYLQILLYLWKIPKDFTIFKYDFSKMAGYKSSNQIFNSVLTPAAQILKLEQCRD